MEDRKNTVPSQGTKLNDEELDQAAGGFTPGDSLRTKCAYCGKEVPTFVAVEGRDGKSYCGQICEQKAFLEQRKSDRKW